MLPSPMIGCIVVFKACTKGNHQQSFVVLFCGSGVEVSQPLRMSIIQLSYTWRAEHPNSACYFFVFIWEMTK